MTIVTRNTVPNGKFTIVNVYEHSKRVARLRALPQQAAEFVVSLIEENAADAGYRCIPLTVRHTKAPEASAY